MIDFSDKNVFLVDMDGTIVDSHPVLYKVYLDFMQKMGFEGSEEEFQELVGPSIPEVVAILRNRYGIDLSIEDLVGQYHQALESVYVEELQLFGGVLDFLTNLKREGKKVALVTSATKQLAKEFLLAKEIAELFDNVVNPENGKGKPAPDIYLKALEEMACEPGESVVIEDSPNGIQAAVNAGISTVHIFDSRLPPALMQHPLVTHVKDWPELQKVYEESNGSL